MAPVTTMRQTPPCSPPCPAVLPPLPGRARLCSAARPPPLCQPHRYRPASLAPAAALPAASLPPCSARARHPALPVPATLLCPPPPHSEKGDGERRLRSVATEDGEGDRKMRCLERGSGCPASCVLAPGEDLAGEMGIEGGEGSEGSGLIAFFLFGSGVSV
nr:proline-rich protein 36-like [Aegilops tauschii subsp. strangulata]